MSDINVTIVAATNASASILNSDVVNVAAGPGFIGGGATALLVSAGANVTVTTAQGTFTVIGRDVPVLSVNGKTGTVVLTAADVGGLTSVANVASVNGRTGVVSLVSADVSAASAVHSHVAANITDLTSVANVSSVNGRTGAVTLVSTDVSAASAVHSHVAANITDLTSVANVVKVNGITGSPTIVAGANVTVSTAGSSITISAAGGGGTTGGAVSSVNGKTGTVVLTLTDVSAASASHSHVAADVTNLTAVANVVSVNGITGTPTIVAGANVTVSSSGSSITISAASGAGGGGGSAEDTALRAFFVPPAPTNVVATGGNAQAAVTWTAPTVLAQIPITDYIVQYSSDGSTWTTFSDGTSTSTSATVTGLTNGTAYQFRVAAVNGVGTGAYSTASAAVTPASGDPLFGQVALLLHMDGTGSTFTDSSAAPRTITVTGNATQSATQSKFGGKSMHLDGSGDYLSIAASSALGLGTGDFCVEYWWYPTQNSGDETLIDFRESNSDTPFLIGKSSAGAIRCYDGATVRTGGSMNLNAWNHVAWSRTSGDNQIYLNGTRVIQFSNSFDAGSSRGVTIGSNVNPAFENCAGYVDEIRITKGNNRSYTGASITVPTAAFPEAVPNTDPYFSSVILLLKADGSGSSFVDSSNNAATITAYGDTTQSAAQSKWGGKSAYFDGNGDSLTVASSASVSGTGDFTIEFWARPTAFGTAYCVWLANETSYGFATSINNNGTVSFGRSLVSSDGTTSNAVDFGQWNHVALCRSSGTLRIYINGVKGYDAAVSTSFASGTVRIGTDGGGSALPYSGYIDDLRITTVARYTGSTIAVPTAAFPTS